jgi:iron complex outermembrane receptor protein
MSYRWFALSVWASAALAIGAAACAPASAQMAAVAQGPQLQEVTVTATRVKTPAERTAVSLEVYSSADLAREDIHDLASLAAVDPSLQYTPNGGRGVLTLRGVSSNNTSETGAPSVPVSVDDFVINRPSALYSTLFDISSIQVLRGPQGTLFGRAASGGLIDITTNRPTRHYQTSGDIEFGNYNMVNVDGAFNIPMSKTLQVRFAVMARRHMGYRRNTMPEQGANPANPDDEDSKGGRVEVAWEPTNRLRALLIYQSLNINQAGFAVEAIPFNWDNLALGINSDISHAKPPLGNPMAFPMYGPGQWYHHQDNVIKWHFHYKLPFGATLSYLGGYDRFSHNELDSADPPWPVQVYPALGQYYPTPFNYTEKPATQNHELRISGTSGNFQYQGGLYYFSENNQLFAQSLANPGSVFAEFVPNFGNAFLYRIHTRSKAAYGQASWRFTPHNTFSLGGRYSEDSIHRYGYFIAPSSYPPGPPSSYYIAQNGAASSSKFTYHVGYNWTPTKQTLVYGTVSSGYKPGAFSSCGSQTIPYLPETVTNFELGTKNMLEHRTLELNVDVFYEDYTNMQINTPTRLCDTGGITTNAGKSRIYGVESNLIALVPRLGRINLSLNYLNAKFVTFYGTPEIGPQAMVDCRKIHNFVTPSGQVYGQQCDLGGYTMPQAPALTAALSLEHTWALPDDGTLRLRAEGHWSSKQYLTVWNFPDETQGAYGTADVFLTYARPRWSIGLFARNVTNTVYLTFAQENAGGVDYLYSYGAPRVYGVRLAMHLDR